MEEYIRNCLGFGTILLLGYFFIYAHNKMMKKEHISFKIYFFAACTVYLLIGGK